MAKERNIVLKLPGRHANIPDSKIYLHLLAGRKQKQSLYRKNELAYKGSAYVGIYRAK
jgi:hypothetical protein